MRLLSFHRGARIPGPRKWSLSPFCRSLALSTGLLLLGSGCAATRSSAAPSAESGGQESSGRSNGELRYEIHYRPGAERGLDVAVTLPPDHPRHFLFATSDAVRQLAVTSASGAVRTVVPTAQGELELEPEDRLVHYRFAFPGHASLVQGTTSDDGAVIAGKGYLLRPRQARPGRSAQLQFTGSSVTVPWAATGAPGHYRPGHYRVGELDLVDAGFHTFGGRRCAVAPAGPPLEIRLLGAPGALGDAAVCGWVMRAAREVLTVRRTFPFPRVAVTAVMEPSGAASRFGMLLWSDPPSLALFAGQAATARDLEQDWIAVHEMLHLVHPSLLRQGPWLSEGLATYYTEVARMRSGRLTQEEGWTELVEGFARGAADGGDESVATLAGKRGGYLGYYWGGAAIVLELDVSIRKATGGARSLEDALELLARRGNTATLPEVGAAIDETAGVPVWEAMTRRRLAQPPAAGVEELLRQLGVVRQGGRLTFDPKAPDSAVRAAISAPLRRLSPDPVTDRVPARNEGGFHETVRTEAKALAPGRTTLSCRPRSPPTQSKRKNRT